MLSVSFSTIQSDDYAHSGWVRMPFTKPPLLRFARSGRVWAVWSVSIVLAAFVTTVATVCWKNDDRELRFGRRFPQSRRLIVAGRDSNFR